MEACIVVTIVHHYYAGSSSRWHAVLLITHRPGPQVSASQLRTANVPQNVAYHVHHIMYCISSWVGHIISALLANHTNSNTSQLKTTWRHDQMETFTALLTLCVGKSPVPGEFFSQRPVMQSFDVFFDLHLSKWLSKQSWGWWCETPSHSLWRHPNDVSHLTDSHAASWLWLCNSLAGIPLFWHQPDPCCQTCTQQSQAPWTCVHKLCKWPGLSYIIPIWWLSNTTITTLLLTGL